MADYKRETDEPAGRTMRDRLDRLEEEAREMQTAIERLAGVLEQACREIGMEVRAFRD